MFVLFGFINFLIFVNFSSQYKLPFSNDKDEANNSSSVSNHDADHVLVKHLHKVYNADLKKKETDVKQLLILKQQYIVRNHIEEFETDFALHFEPDWSKVDKWSSPCRQCIEIRRQKWEYIFTNHSDLYQVQSLSEALRKSGVERDDFCREIAEAYFILSHNAYVYNRGPKPSDDLKVDEFVKHPLMEKSLRAFIHVFADALVKLNETDDLIQIPKSAYHELLRKDAHINLLKKHHESEMERQKKHYKHVIEEIRDENESQSYSNTDFEHEYNDSEERSRIG